MNLLCIETSTSTLSLAFFENGFLKEEEIIPPSEKLHAEKLLPAIDELLKRVGCSLNNLEGITLSAGPGSFTSLRVGLATALGLALPRNLPLYLGDSLENIERQYRGRPLCLPDSSGERKIFSLLLAGRGRVYVRENPGKEISQVVNPANLQCPPGSILLGPGAALVEPFLDPAKNYTVLKEIIPLASILGSLVTQGKIKPTSCAQARLFYAQEPDLGGPKPSSTLAPGKRD